MFSEKYFYSIERLKITVLKSQTDHQISQTNSAFFAGKVNLFPREIFKTRCELLSKQKTSSRVLISIFFVL